MTRTGKTPPPSSGIHVARLPAIKQRELFESRGLPVVPGTRPGVRTWDEFQNQLVSARLAITTPEGPPRLMGSVWVKVPRFEDPEKGTRRSGITSRPIDSMEGLRVAFEGVVGHGRTIEMAAELFIESAFVVIIHFVTGPEQILADKRRMSLEVRTREGEKSTRPLSKEVRASFKELALKVVQDVAHKGPGAVELLVGNGDTYVYKLKDGVQARKTKTPGEMPLYLADWFAEGKHFPKTLPEAFSILWGMEQEHPNIVEELIDYLAEMPRDCEEALSRFAQGLKGNPAEADKIRVIVCRALIKSADRC